MKAIFGQPETGGVVLDPPNVETKRKAVRVQGYIQVRVEVDEVFEADADTDDRRIISDALDLVDFTEGHIEYKCLDIEWVDDLAVDRYSPRVDIRTLLAEWNAGLPIKAAS